MDLQMQGIKVSVITPCYNTGKVVRRLYDSLERQTFKDFEWVVADDGSTDDTCEIIQELAEEAPFRCSLLKLEHGGVSNARNSAIDKATGAYLVFADSDDYLPDDALETLLSGLEKGFDCCFGCRAVLTGDGEAIEKPNCRSRSFNSSEAFLGQVCRKDIRILFTSVLYRRDVIEKNNLRFRTDLKFTEDDLFMYQYFSCCRSILQVKKIVYCYIHSGSNSTNSIDRSRIEGTVRARTYLFEALGKQGISRRTIRLIDNTIFRKKFMTLFIMYYKRHASFAFMEIPGIRELAGKMTRPLFFSWKDAKTYLKLKLFLISYPFLAKLLTY